jgi:hypothetical protein
MTQVPKVEPSPRIKEEEAYLVLARAAELDAHLPSTVTLHELWSSAAAAGITRESFEQAAAELRAGKLARTDGRVAITAALARTGQVALAVALIYAAFRTPDYSGWWAAQSIGAAWAVYGAYKTVGAVTGWFGGLRGHGRVSSEAAPGDVPLSAPRDDTSMALRVFNLRPTPSRAV